MAEISDTERAALRADIQIQIDKIVAGGGINAASAILLGGIVDAAKELGKERDRYKKAYYTLQTYIDDNVARVLGYEHNEEYGWVTGDHVPETLIAELVVKYENLRSYRPPQETVEHCEYCHRPLPHNAAEQLVCPKYHKAKGSS